MGSAITTAAVVKVFLINSFSISWATHSHPGETTQHHHSRDVSDAYLPPFVQQCGIPATKKKAAHKAAFS
jgi:hypothetical protein